MALQEGDRRDDEGQGGEGCVGPLPAPTCDAVQGHNPATNRGDCTNSGELLLVHSDSVDPLRGRACGPGVSN